MPKSKELDYDTVWEVMSNLDETVQKCKQINDMCDDMLSTVIEWTDADEVIDTIDLLRGYSKYILRELENNSIVAWNETVVKLNPNNKRQSHSDLDALDKDWETIFKDNPEFLLHPSLLTNSTSSILKKQFDKDDRVHDSEGC
tara:strand:- start:1857 stop:2285 length:429 start_codon:yes stop_codon:yes gene_type:complete